MRTYFRSSVPDGIGGGLSQRAAYGLEPAFTFLRALLPQAQSVANDFAVRGVAATLDLLTNHLRHVRR